ncbi:MAG TPA: J domain-containing protein, partial [Bacteroidales bacterium]|nr:J domain-containing protein [Bacteroidales bacterium]
RLVDRVGNGLQARQEYQEWQQARSQAAPLVRPALDARQQKELSVLYRKISKRCHPDLVNEEQREDAARIFHRLNAAYVAADLEAMHQLLKLLEEGGLPLARKDRGVTEVERLTLQLRRMEQEVAMLLREIAEVEESAIWQLVSTLEDEDAYFSRIRDRLSRELEKEEREYERRRSAPTE